MMRLKPIRVPPLLPVENYPATPSSASSRNASCPLRRRASYKVSEGAPMPFPGVELARDAKPVKISLRGCASTAPNCSSPSSPPATSVKGVVSPTTGRAYVFLGSINPSAKVDKAVVLCMELERRGDSWKPTERRHVVVKMSNVGQDLDRVGEQVEVLSERGDNPVEEVKAMHFLTTRGGAADSSGIVPLLDYFADEEGWLYIVMPYYEVSLLRNPRAQPGSGGH